MAALRAVARMMSAALAAAEPGAAVERCLEWAGPAALLVRGGGGAAGSGVRVALDGVEEAVVVGAGKAAVPMAAALLRLLDARPHEAPRLAIRGALVTKYGHAGGGGGEGLARRGIRVFEAAHPVPDGAGVEAAAALLEEVHAASATPARTIVFVVLSGGASALTPSPPPGATLADLAALNAALLACGAPIDDMNAVRKHCSSLTGGRLAAAAGATRVITLALSDVNGDRLDVIGSGPTVPDPSTFADAVAVIERYGLAPALPPALATHLAAGVAGRVADTPKAPRAGDVAVVVAGNRVALDAAAAAAESAGYHPVVLTSRLEGEAGEVAKLLAGIAVDAAPTAVPPSLDSAAPFRRPAVLLAGGEPTVTLPPGAGMGGRNQHLVLATALAVRRLAPPGSVPAITVAAMGTDGTDGPTDAAGAAIAAGDPALATPAATLAARRCDAYTFLARAGAADTPTTHGSVTITPGGHIMTGPTGTNVMDVVAIVVE